MNYLKHNYFKNFKHILTTIELISFQQKISNSISFHGMDVESGSWLSLKLIFGEKSSNKAKAFLSWKDQVSISRQFKGSVQNAKKRNIKNNAKKKLAKCQMTKQQK